MTMRTSFQGRLQLQLSCAVLPISALLAACLAVEGMEVSGDERLVVPWHQGVLADLRHVRRWSAHLVKVYRGAALRNDHQS